MEAASNEGRLLVSCAERDRDTASARDAPNVAVFTKVTFVPSWLSFFVIFVACLRDLRG
jgi:hypothetical protein